MFYSEVSSSCDLFHFVHYILRLYSWSSLVRARLFCYLPFVLCLDFCVHLLEYFQCFRNVSEREGGGGTETETETDRQTDRQRHIDTQTDRQTDRDTQRQPARDSQPARQTVLRPACGAVRVQKRPLTYNTSRYTCCNLQ